MAAVVEDSTEGAAASTAVVSGGITEAGVELAGMGVGAVMAGVDTAGAEAGVDTAGAAGDTQAGELELASALGGAGVGVPIGRATRMRMAIHTAIPTTPIIRITRTMGRTRMRQPTRIGITVATEIRVTTHSSRIRAIPVVRDRLA
jgi:hypothetical protein